MKEYFSHDYYTRNDIKIKRLIQKHGMCGYGVFWAIIEDLYNNANALPLHCDTIAYDLRIDEDVVHSIIHDFDLFVIEGDTFGSLSVEKRIIERNQKSKKASISALSRWNKSERNANALPTQSDSNAIKEKKRKGKEIKVNIIEREEEKNDLPNSSNSASPSKIKSFKNWNLEDFKQSISQHRGAAPDLNSEDLKLFFRHWAEKSASGRMKFQMERTWETDLRLQTWQRREQSYRARGTPIHHHTTKPKSTVSQFE